MGEYYEYTQSDGEDESDSNDYDHCDCLRTNPLLGNTENCRIGLDQDSFNEENEDKKVSKRSVNDDELNENVNNDWRLSSSLATLKNYLEINKKAFLEVNIRILFRMHYSIDGHAKGTPGPILSLLGEFGKIRLLPLNFK